MTDKENDLTRVMVAIETLAAEMYQLQKRVKRLEEVK